MICCCFESLSAIGKTKLQCFIIEINGRIRLRKQIAIDKPDSGSVRCLDATLANRLNVFDVLEYFLAPRANDILQPVNRVSVPLLAYIDEKGDARKVRVHLGLNSNVYVVRTGPRVRPISHHVSRWRRSIGPPQ